MKIIGEFAVMTILQENLFHKWKIFLNKKPLYQLIW